MSYKKYLIAGIFVLIVICGLGIYFFNGNKTEKISGVSEKSSHNADVINDVVFICPKNKNIHAVFYKNRTVNLELSDGRKMVLPQVISGSGARYANSDESFGSNTLFGRLAFLSSKYFLNHFVSSISS
jgi:membrane-bound inhibitor of C-type lysozyme